MAIKSEAMCGPSALTYDPASDQLKGIYYQAVEKQRFPVAFVRMK